MKAQEDRGARHPPTGSAFLTDLSIRSAIENPSLPSFPNQPALHHPKYSMKLPRSLSVLLIALQGVVAIPVLHPITRQSNGRAFANGDLHLVNCEPRSSEAGPVSTQWLSLVIVRFSTINITVRSSPILQLTC